MSTHDEIRTLADQVLRDLEQSRIDSDARFKTMMEQCDKMLAAIDAAKAGVKALNAEDDGWIPWDDGVCPVGLRVCVRVKLRDGETICGPAANFHWAHYEEACDIVSYKVEE